MRLQGAASAALRASRWRWLGAHPSAGKEIKLLEGRYGPYVSDGTVHATLPKSTDPKS